MTERKIIAMHAKGKNKAMIVADDTFCDNGHNFGFTNNGAQWTEYPITKDMATVMVKALTDFLELESNND